MFMSGARHKTEALRFVRSWILVCSSHLGEDLLERVHVQTLYLEIKRGR